MSNEELLKQILDFVSEGVYFVDRDRRITYWNQGAEKISGYLAGEIVGTRCPEAKLKHIDQQGTLLCGEGCPLQHTIQDGKDRSADVFLHHKNGHRVPVRVRATPIRDASGEIIGAVEIFNDLTPRIATLEKIKNLRQKAYIDSLTGLANRRFAEMYINSLFTKNNPDGRNAGLILIDIDDFKAINDRYGHEVGDRVLVMTANALRGAARVIDMIARWGGEEFIATMLDVDENGLHTAAERIRHMVARSGLPYNGQLIQVTISGGATIKQPGDTPASLVKRADRLLYKSKQRGKNTTITSGDAD
jgi:diguanylate cyclase (GGDEF)-like protein/PAS domain S-box-containing protein